MKDIRQSDQYAEFLARTGWKILELNKTYVYTKKIPLVGSLIKLQRTNNLPLSDLESIALKNKAYKIVIEPSDDQVVQILKINNYKLSDNPFLVTKTIHIDLLLEIDQIYKQMEKRTRREIRQTSHIKTYDIDNIEQFYEAWQKSINYKKTIPPFGHLQAIKNSFRRNCLILITPNATSGAIFLYANNVGCYWYAFSNEQGRKEKAQYKILWAGINWVKQRGGHTFDMEGIYDKRFPLKNWKGFSKFKKGFGGNIVEFPGTFVKNRLPI